MIGLLSILLLTLGCEAKPAVKSEEINPTEPEVVDKNNFVSRVIDGDTFELSNGSKVRLICTSSPERGKEYYGEAKHKLESLILNKEVVLEKDVSETDAYGRLLRYVYINNSFVNKEMIGYGLAEVFRYGQDTKLCDELEIEQAAAKELKAGIWSERIVIEIAASINDNDCNSNIYNCADFSSQSDAQALYDACGGISNDVHIRT